MISAGRPSTIVLAHNRADPYAYLLDVMDRIKQAAPEELESLLPDRWLQAHPEAYLEHRAIESHAMKNRKRVRRIARHAKLATH